MARLTRSRLGAGRRVTWEGQAYRIDVGAAERDRIARVRGRDAQARLDAAWSAFALSDLQGVPDAPDAIARIARVVALARLDRTPGIDERLGIEARTAAATARRLLERGTVDRDWPEIRRSLDDLGDALATEALAEMAYAVSLGWAEDLPLTALAAFRRHVFARPSPTGMLDASWLAPDILTARGEAWHVVGSLLGLDDALAPVALRRPSLKPLGAAPSLNTGDRRWLVTTIAALDRGRFTDDAQRQLAAAVARGEARVRGSRGADAARQVAEDAGATPLRQALAAWIAEVNPSALGGVLSLTELVRLGSDGGAAPATLDGWGTAQRPVTGRITGGPLPSWPWERYAGRSLRLVSCALPDLQLTLALRLTEMDLPALLVVDSHGPGHLRAGQHGVAAPRRRLRGAGGIRAAHRLDCRRALPRAADDGGTAPSGRRGGPMIPIRHGRRRSVDRCRPAPRRGDRTGAGLVAAAARRGRGRPQLPRARGRRGARSARSGLPSG